LKVKDVHFPPELFKTAGTVMKEAIQYNDNSLNIYQSLALSLLLWVFFGFFCVVFFPLMSSQSNKCDHCDFNKYGFPTYFSWFKMFPTATWRKVQWIYLGYSLY